MVFGYVQYVRRIRTIIPSYKLCVDTECTEFSDVIMGSDVTDFIVSAECAVGSEQWDQEFLESRILQLSPSRDLKNSFSWRT